MRRKFEKAPIILGGCPRSGTSLLLSILSAHPNIYCLQEEAWAFYATETLSEFENYINQWLWPHFPHGIEKTYKRWCEKTPKNILAFDNLLKYFGPELRLIHIVRDGRDVITSRHPQDTTKFWVEDWKWIWYVKEGMRFLDHPQVFTVKYEDIILSYEPTIRKICKFIDEECTESIINWYENTRIKEHSAWPREVSPISSKSIGKWKRYCDDELMKSFLKNAEAQAVLAHFGYL